MANNLGDLIDGSIDLDDAFIDLAEHIGQVHLAGFVTGSIANVTDAELVIDEVFGFESGVATDGSAIGIHSRRSSISGSS